MSVLLEGKKVRLRPFEPEMAPTFKAWMEVTENRHLIGGAAYPISLSAQEEWVQDRVKVSWEDRVHLAIEAVDGPEPVLIGNLVLRDLHAEARRCDVGILIGEPGYRGGGYGTEAMRLACQFAFEEMGLERVELDTFEFNTRAVRSYEKVGFVVEGRRRRRAYLGGRYYDEISMGLLREEFRHE